MGGVAGILCALPGRLIIKLDDGSVKQRMVFTVFSSLARLSRAGSVFSKAQCRAGEGCRAKYGIYCVARPIRRLSRAKHGI